MILSLDYPGRSIHSPIARLYTLALPVNGGRSFFYWLLGIMSDIDMSYTAQRRRILLDESLTDIDLEREDIPVKVDPAEGEPEAALEDTLESIEQEVSSLKENMLVIKTQLFGANGEGGFCKQMQESSQNTTDAIMGIRADIEVNQGIIRSEMARINEKQDTELEAFRIMLTEMESRQSLMNVRIEALEDAMKSHKTEHENETKDRKENRFRWYHAALAFIGVAIAVIEVISILS